MSDKNDRHALPTEELKRLHDPVARLAIQSSSRLIGKDQRGPVGQGARDSDTLLLTPGELARAMVPTMVKTDQREEFVRALTPLLATNAGVEER